MRQTGFFIDSNLLVLLIVGSVGKDLIAKHRRLRQTLTDAALLEAVTEERPLITVDLDLYLAAIAKSRNAAMNFTHLQRL